MTTAYSWKPILVLADDLIRFAWSAPLRDLADLVDLSDVGLRKQLVGYGIPLPPQGYWNKVRAGKEVAALPKPEPRKPGQLGRLSVDSRFANVIAITDPMPAAGPFASAVVPENLDDLLEQEMRAIGAVKVPKTLGHAPPGLDDVLRREEKRRVKSAKSGWSFDGPRFDAPVSQRQLRIWSVFYSTLVRRGHTGIAYEHDGLLICQVRIGDTPIGVEIDVTGHSRHRHDRKRVDNLPASTPISLRINPRFDGHSDKIWQDDKEGTIEEKLAAIVATTIVAGEASFREELRRAEEHEAQEAVRRDEEKRKKKQALNDRRLSDLKSSGDLLRQARDIRLLVAEVRQAMEEGSDDIAPSDLASWEKWALREADKLDPILSGHFRTHLSEPELDE